MTIWPLAMAKYLQVWVKRPPPHQKKNYEGLNEVLGKKVIEKRKYHKGEDTHVYYNNKKKTVGGSIE